VLLIFIISIFYGIKKDKKIGDFQNLKNVFKIFKKSQAKFTIQFNILIKNLKIMNIFFKLKSFLIYNLNNL